MANQSNFPTTIDTTPTDRTSGDSVPSSDWNIYTDAAVNLETKVGVDSSAVTGSIDYKISNYPTAGVKSRIVQIVNTQTGAVATGTTLIPNDDTIPLSGEGNQYMTLAITPTNVNNKLKIDVVFVGSSNVDNSLGVALFQDATTNAIAAVWSYIAIGTYITITFSHYMAAGTTSATTFRVRAGGHGAGTTTFNGQAGGRIYGGVMASSITITEIGV